MTAEQKARDMLERAGVEDAQSMSAGNLVELANMIADNAAFKDIIRALADHPTKTAALILMERARSLL